MVAGGANRTTACLLHVMNGLKDRSRYMLNISAKIDCRKKMEQFVDSCRLETPEEVSRLFREYTLLIWDYWLVGRIADFYPDDIIIHQAGGRAAQGIDAVYANTIAILAHIPRDNQTIFIDIFAEGNPVDGYSFCQATTNYIPSKNGGETYTPPEGRMYSDTVIGSVGLCECRVHNVDGRWKIVEEWLVRTPVAEGTLRLRQQ